MNIPRVRVDCLELIPIGFQSATLLASLEGNERYGSEVLKQRLAKFGLDFFDSVLNDQQTDRKSAVYFATLLETMQEIDVLSPNTDIYAKVREYRQKLCDWTEGRVTTTKKNVDELTNLFKGVCDHCSFKHEELRGKVGIAY